MKSFFSSLGFGPTKSPEVLAAEKLLPPEALKAVQQDFVSRAGKRTYLPVEEAVALLGMGESHNTQYGEVVARALCVEAPPEGLTIGDLIIAKAKARGGESALREYFFRLLAGPGNSSISKEKLSAAAAGSLAFMLHGEEEVEGSLVESLVESALDDKSGMDEGAWTKFCKQNPLVVVVLRAILAGHDDLRLPKLDLLRVDPSFLSSQRCRMSKSRAALLSCGMAPKQREKWELLFHSDKNGKSFNTFMGTVSGRGSTLVIVSDKAGNVFGGFAGQPWEKAGTYTGDFSCFVFSLVPAAAVYKPSGVNENFQWCGHNFNALPNGFGFGGQVGFYAIFIDDTMDKGMTRPAATYNSPAFAKEQHFEVETVECWLVELSEEELERRETSGTAMDRFKETNNYLKIAGAQADYSSAYRDDRPPDVEDNTSKFR